MRINIQKFYLKIYFEIRFKQQEEFLVKKIEELTQSQFNQTELIENQEKLAKYNEKCRNELNDLRKHFKNSNDDFTIENTDEHNIILSANKKQNLENQNLDFLDSHKFLTK